MRFIAEFESGKEDWVFMHKSIKASELGAKITSALGWKEVGETAALPDSHVAHKYRLEIEAFPMDKWIEFKNKLFTYLSDTDGMVSGTRILQMFKDIESFGKSAGAAKET